MDISKDVKDVLYGLIGCLVYVFGAMLMGIVAGCVIKLFVCSEVRF